LYLGVSIPKMQLRNRAVLVYWQPQTDGRKVTQAFRIANMAEQRKKSYSGKLSPGAKKRLAKAVTVLVKGTRRRWITNPVTKRQHLHQLSFVTLTVAGGNSSLDGKTAYRQLLAPFLAWLRKTKKVNTYVWKAELQKNGQLHYHITMPDFIHYREIRSKWNELQRKAGLLAAYHAEHGHYDPNSTDIHTVMKMHDMAAYMIKEITKNVQNEISIGGKVWDCSANLSEAKYFTTEMKERHFHFMETAVNEELATKYVAEQFTIYRFNEQVEEHLLTAEDLNGYRTWLEVLRASIHYNDPPE
jgi:hypothetical protein